MVTITQGTQELDAAVAAAQAGDQAAFSGLVERYRPELQVHCYRMLGSFEESEDLTQETFLRAWRKRAGFRGRSTFRAWLYRIATNACLDALAKRPRRPPAESEVPWLQPYPDSLLEQVPATDAEPDAAVVSKETIELAFLAAIQHLSPKQRAVFILRDVLGWSGEGRRLDAGDERALGQQRPPASPSDAQEAPARPPRRLGARLGSDARGECARPALRGRARAHDLDALREMMAEDARFSMPPEAVEVWTGRDAIVDAWVEGLGNEEYSDFRCLVTRANRQPAVANYLRRPGDSEYRALAVDMLRVEDGRIAEIVAFHADVFPALGLPPKLPA